MYGLNEASQYSYERIKNELLRLGVEKTHFDEALFYHRYQNSLHGIIVIHVHDFLWGGGGGGGHVPLKKMLSNV